jgi:hypothetical protein
MAQNDAFPQTRVDRQKKKRTHSFKAFPSAARKFGIAWHAAGWNYSNIGFPPQCTAATVALGPRCCVVLILLTCGGGDFMSKNTI